MQRLNQAQSIRVRNMRSVEPKKSSSLVKLYLLPPIAKMLIALFIFLFIATIGTLYLKYDAAQQLKQSKEKKAALESELTVRAKEYGELVYFSKDVVHAKQEQHLLRNKLIHHILLL